MAKKPIRTEQRSSQPADIALGLRIRATRLKLGISQEVFGNALGVSFQQVQKYEKGVNRVSASRLEKISEVLGVSTNELYGKDEAGNAYKQDTRLLEMMSTKTGLRLIHGFHALDERQRNAFVTLIETIT